MPVALKEHEKTPCCGFHADNDRATLYNDRAFRHGLCNAKDGIDAPAMIRGFGCSLELQCYYGTEMMLVHDV